jgi:hypothetical protein
VTSREGLVVMTHINVVVVTTAAKHKRSCEEGISTIGTIVNREAIGGQQRNDPVVQHEQG